MKPNAWGKQSLEKVTTGPDVFWPLYSASPEEVNLLWNFQLLERIDSLIA